MIEETYIPTGLFKENPYKLPSLDLIVRHTLIMISHRDVDIVYYSSLLILVNTTAIMSKIFILR